MGSKIAYICQKTQAEEAVARDDNSSRNIDHKKGITISCYEKWCAQDKINNKLKSVIQKHYAYNYIRYKYLQKVYEQRKKLNIPRKDSIENYKSFNKSYTNENNGLTVVDTSSEVKVRNYTRLQDDPRRK